MFNKLSNSAGIKEVEGEFKLPFRFPHIYRPKKVIDGFQENILPVITMDRPENINFAIWGMLPEDYEGEWEAFQDHTNTLNIRDKALETKLWYSRVFEKQRCLVIATGFYTFYMLDGDVFPFYVFEESGAPMSLAGVYTELEDGFLTTSVLTTDACGRFRDVNNLNDAMPVVIPPGMRELWLDGDLPKNALQDIMQTSKEVRLTAYPVTTSVFNSKTSPLHPPTKHQDASAASF